MNEHDAYEQAYNNGYSDGMRAQYEKIIRCKDCDYYHDGICLRYPISFPRNTAACRKPEDFCSYAVKKDS